MDPVDPDPDSDPQHCLEDVVEAALHIAEAGHDAGEVVDGNGLRHLRQARLQDRAGFVQHLEEETKLQKCCQDF